jgi:SAM-dependent methyltransferase
VSVANSRLIDPDTGTPLRPHDGALVGDGGVRHPIVDGIPRFVSSDNYASAFGEQWVRFPKTQLDSHSGIPVSEVRLERCLRGSLRVLRGKLVLEAGSGAGRFTELLLKHGAIVDSFDFSAAVAANASNNGTHPRLTLVQADIRRIPFTAESYDCVLCLGVIQHTPDPEESIASLWSRVRPGGQLVFDHYRWKLRNFMPPPFGVAGIAYRRYFLRLTRERQFSAVKDVFDFWFPWIWRFRDMYYEWMLLDTHDAMTDVYKHRRTAREIRRLLQRMGAVEIEVTYGGNGVEASCRKPV